MAEIRCPQCGRDNPDFLDLCQFCQSPLKPASTLHIGETPTKKDTGELEAILPEWLKSARQQSRDSAEEDAVQAAAQPKPRKEEPRDLLAGLAFQAESSEEEEVPDWLSSLNPTSQPKPAAPAEPADAEAETDFFAQFNQQPPTPAQGSAPSSESTSSPQGSRDELSDWFSETSEQSVEPFTIEPDSSQGPSDWGTGDQGAAPKEEEDLSWLRNLEAIAKQTDELKAPKSDPNWESELSKPSQNSDQEDLSWLDALGGTSPPSATGSEQEDLSWLDSLGAPSVEQPSAASTTPQEDLSWLDSLGGTQETPQSAASQPSAAEDLDWLNKLGAASSEGQVSEWQPPQDSQPASPTESSSQDDMDWLSSLGAGTSEATSQELQEPIQSGSFSEPFESAAPLSGESTSGASDLSWLDNLGAMPAQESSKSGDDLGWLGAFAASTESSQPDTGQPAGQDDLSWLSNLQGESESLSASPFAEPPATEASAATDSEHVSPFVPRKTAPLDGESDASIPDWLRSATEEPSMPMNVGALDQFREDYKTPSAADEPFSWKSFTQGTKATDDAPQSTAEPAFTDVPPAGPSVPSDEDVNSIFAMEMPDWLSQPDPTKQEDTSQPVGIHAESGDALAPVDLPSWVQAMRPVDAAISEAGPSVENQPTEREGPLAGFRGLIPTAPIGSARRPKPISLKLQTTDEQQGSASILEQLLAAETSPRPAAGPQAVTSQRMLRWVLSALFILVLGAILGLRSQMFVPPVPPPVGVNEVSAVIQQIPASSNVLVVVDYEPALAGEIEAVGGPLLDQLAFSRRPRLSFVSTSTSGPALVDRLLSNTKINQPSAVNGLEYGLDQDYFNLGYLPGAESGVLAFIQSPGTALPSANDAVNTFGDYAAVIVMTDNAASARIWIEQLQTSTQPLLIASSAQAGPLLQPYLASQQVDGLVTGLADASRFEFMNNSRPGIARSYWDAFTVGLIMAVGLIFLGSLWGLFAGMRARRAEAAEG